MDNYQQQPPIGTDPLQPQQSVGYIPQNNMNVDSMMSKNPDSSEILLTLKNTLLGLEYNDDEDEWKPVMKVIGYDKK